MNCEYVNGLEKVESTDDVLTGNVGKEFVSYCTRYMRELEQYSLLKSLLDAVEKIDFLLAYYAGKDTESYILELREEFTKTNDEKRKKEIKRSLKEIDPSTESKLTIVVENLMSITEHKKFGLGVMNETPYYYNGCYWEILPEGLVKHYLSAVAEKSGLPHFQVAKVKIQDVLYKQFLATAAMPPKKQSVQKVMINLKNGTFVCENGSYEIRPFSPEDRLTYQLSFEYDPNAKAPKFLQFLDEVIPEKEARMVVAEYIGYIFAKHLRWEKCLVLLGSGANGKSVLIDIVTALLGAENVCHFSLNRLTEANGYYRAELEKFLLNACSEIGIKNSESEMVKQLFSCDPVAARSPYGKPITVSNYCRFMFSANLISNKDLEQSHGFFRKFMYVEFNAPVPEWKKNPNLAKEIIEEELSGVFNWVLEGLGRILQKGKKGFTFSAHIDNVGKRIERNSNSIALFMDAYNYQRSSNHTDSKTLYSEYKDYCDENRYGATSKQVFLSRLEEQLKFEVKRNATDNATWVFCERKMLPATDDKDQKIADELERALKKIKN